MRVCYFGTYRAEYARNRLMIDRLRRSGIDVVECHVRLWRGPEDRVAAAAGGWRRPRFWWRLGWTYLRLLWRYRRAGEYDVMMVGYPGQADVLLARRLSRLRGKPLVWDILMSIYLIACERRTGHDRSTSARFLRALERAAIQMPDMLIVDTAEYARWYQENYGVGSNRVRLLPLGADDRVFKPLPVAPKRQELFCCLYHGTFIPNHGVTYIVDAANLLRDRTDIHFELIGSGPELSVVRGLAESYGLNNVTFFDWLPAAELVERIAAADICLGTFGVTPQALMTVQNKIHEAFAMAKPVVNGDSPAMRSTLKHGEEIYLCKRQSSEAIARAILHLKNDDALRERLSKNAYSFYMQHLSFDSLANKIASYLEEVVSPDYRAARTRA